MITISIERDPKKDFSVFEVVNQAIFRMKDVGTTGHHIDLELNGFTQEQSKAIFSVLYYSYDSVIGPHPIQAVCHSQDKNHKIYTVQGIGKLEIDISPDSKASYISFPTYSPGALPAYEMREAVKHIKTMFLRSEGPISDAEMGEYYLLPFHNPQVMNSVVSVFLDIMQAQTDVQDGDIGIRDKMHNELAKNSVLYL